MDDTVLCIGGLIVVLVVLIVVNDKNEKKRKEKHDQFMTQERKFRKWSSERFGPSESDEAESLIPLNPFERGIDKDEKNYRHNIVAESTPNWADEIIRQDRISRERQTEHFKSWGMERFEGSWPETSDRLCRLVSANRTPSMDMLSDSEIETLNSYLLAETLGSVNPTVNAAESDKTARWTQQKCDNCGAPLLKGQCIYCNTSYSHK